MRKHIKLISLLMAFLLVNSTVFAEALFIPSEISDEIQMETAPEGMESDMEENSLVPGENPESDLDGSLANDLPEEPAAVDDPGSDLIVEPDYLDYDLNTEDSLSEETSLSQETFYEEADIPENEENVLLEDELIAKDADEEDVFSAEAEEILEESEGDPSAEDILVEEDVLDAEKVGGGEYYGGTYYSDRVNVVLNQSSCYVSSWNEYPRPDITVYFDGKKLNANEWTYYDGAFGSGPGEYYAVVRVSALNGPYFGKSSSTYKAIAKGKFDIKFIDMNVYPHKEYDSWEIVYRAQAVDLVYDAQDYKTVHEKYSSWVDWTFPYINVYWDGGIVGGDGGILEINGERDFIDREYDLGNEGFNVGTKKVIVHGKGLFAGCSGENEYKILPLKAKLHSREDANGIYPYTGKQITPGIDALNIYVDSDDEPRTNDSISNTYKRKGFYFTPSRDCYIAGYKNNVQPGTATVIIKGKGNYEGSYGEATFEIYKDFTVSLKKDKYTYTGKKIMPEFTVKDGNKTLSSADYTVDYQIYNDRSYVVPSIYHFTVSGKGIYKECVKDEMIWITVPTASITTLSKKDTGTFLMGWQKSNKVLAGVNIETAKNSEFTSGLKKYYYADRDEYTFKGYSSDTYYIRIRGYIIYEGYKHFSEWSPIKTIDLKNGKAGGGSSDSGISMKAPVMKAVYNSTRGGDIRWNKVNGAAGYVVYRVRQAEGTKKVATIKNANTLRCYDTAIKDCYGRVYHYYVKALYKKNGKTVEGPASGRLILQRLAPMRIKSAENSSSKAISLRWECTVQNNKAKGYQIQYAASQDDLNGRKGSYKAVTVKGRKNLKKTINNLSKGKTYYVRVRSYVVYTSSVTKKQTRTWSEYSNVVKVKINR